MACHFVDSQQHGASGVLQTCLVRGAPCQCHPPSWMQLSSLSADLSECCPPQPPGFKSKTIPEFEIHNFVKIHHIFRVVSVLVSRFDLALSSFLRVVNGWYFYGHLNTRLSTFLQKGSNDALFLREWAESLVMLLNVFCPPNQASPKHMPSACLHCKDP